MSEPPGEDRARGGGPVNVRLGASLAAAIGLMVAPVALPAASRALGGIGTMHPLSWLAAGVLTVVCAEACFAEPAPRATPPGAGGAGASDGRAHAIFSHPIFWMLGIALLLLAVCIAALIFGRANFVGAAVSRPAPTPVAQTSAAEEVSPKAPRLPPTAERPTTAIGELAFFGAAQADVRVRLRSVDGQSYSVGAPSLARLSIAPDTAKPAAYDATAELDGRGMTISPAGTDELQTIRGLDRVGRYEGALRFVDADGAYLLDAPFSIVVRRHWWVAMVLIAAGVLLSTAIQAWLTTGRRRLVAQRELRWVEETVASHGSRTDAREARVLGAPRGQIESLERDLSVSVDIGEEIELLVGRVKLLPQLFAATRLASRLRGAAAHAEAQTSLEELADLIDQTRHADLETVQRGAESSRRTIIQALQAQLRAAVDELAEQIRQHASRIPDGRRKSLQRAIQRAREALASNNFEEASERVDRMRDAVATVLIELLENTLSAPSPFAAQHKAWQELYVRVVGEMRGKERDPASSYEAGLSVYLIGLLGICKEELERLEGGPARSEAGARALAAISAAEEALASGGLSRAEEELGTARARLIEAGSKIRARGIVMESTGGGADSDALVAPGLGWALAAAFSLAKHVLPAEPQTPGDLDRRIRSVDFAITCTLLAVAVMSGLRFLWWETEAWGNAGNIMVALLWGFGIHQVGSRPLEGLLTASARR